MDSNTILLVSIGLFVLLLLFTVLDIDELLGVPFVTSSVFGIWVSVTFSYFAPNVVWFIHVTLGVVCGLIFFWGWRTLKKQLTSPNMNGDL